ncbi:hypothetical protein Tco_0088932 [Tanacetum coccineum]
MKVPRTSREYDGFNALCCSLFFPSRGPPGFWLEQNPLDESLTWDDLVSKFINKFSLLLKQTNLRNESRGKKFQQSFDKSFYGGMGTIHRLLRTCPTFMEFRNCHPRLHSIMPLELYSLNRNPEVRIFSKPKPVVAKVGVRALLTSEISPDVAELKDMVKALLLD